MDSLQEEDAVAGALGGRTIQAARSGLMHDPVIVRLCSQIRN